MPQKLKNQKSANEEKHLHLVQFIDTSNVVELLAPGSFVKLHNQPKDLPPFQVINCKGGRCLVRQQSWGNHIYWEVAHNRLKAERA